MSKKIEQACSNSKDLVYALQKIEQACSILKNPLEGTYLTSIYHISSQTAGLAGGSYTIIATCLYVDGIDITCGMILFLLIIISIGYCIGAYYFIGIRD